MATYTYLFCDLLTNAVLDDYQLTNVTFNNSLNAAGSFNGIVPIADPSISSRDFLTATQPGRTALYVDRDGTLVWGGIIWNRSYDADSKALTITGSEFWSYFAKRLILADSLFTQIDQLTIAKTLIDTAQARASGNIGVVTSGIGTSGILRDSNTYGYSRTYVNQVIEEMAGMTDGFDFAIDVAYDGSGNPVKTLNIGYPRRGANVSNTGLVFALPGNIVTYGYPEDASAMADAFYATGSGEGKTALQSSAIQQSQLDGGWPLLEGHNSYSDVTVQHTLDGHAATDLKAANSPVTIPQITVRADQDPSLGAYITGDDIRLVITDVRFPSGLDTYQRITNIAVTPNDSSGQAEQVVLDLQGAL